MLVSTTANAVNGVNGFRKSQKWLTDPSIFRNVDVAYSGGLKEGLISDTTEKRFNVNSLRDSDIGANNIDISFCENLKKMLTPHLNVSCKKYFQCCDVVLLIWILPRILYVIYVSSLLIISVPNCFY